MKSIVEQKSDSISLEVRRLKEENATERGFDLRKIAASAHAQQREQPERMVTRIPTNAELTHGDRPLTRPVLKDEL